MTDLKTARSEAENQTETETPKNLTNQTAEAPAPEEGEGDGEKKEGEVDYKAELLAAQAQLEKKDKIIDHKNRAINSLKKKEDEETEEYGDELDPVEERLEAIRKEQREELAKIKESLTANIVEDEISRVSSSEDEKELIRFHLQHSIKYGYSHQEIKEAVKQAKLLANEKKILDTNRELAEAVRAKSTTNTAPSVAGLKTGKPAGDSKFSKSEQAFIDIYKRQVEADKAKRII